MIMKRYFNTMLPMLAVCLLGVSCEKEERNSNAEDTTVRVRVTLSAEDTKGFADESGLVWEAGNQIKFTGGGNTFESALLTEADIENNGYTAYFTFSGLTDADRRGHIYTPSCLSTVTDATRVEFTKGSATGNVFSQSEAGKMNPDYLFLHNGKTVAIIKKGETPEIKMEIPGSIFRVIPYSASNMDEKVLSVTMSSNTKFVGTVAYNRANATYTYVSASATTAANFIQVNLDTPFSLEGVTDAAKSKGIYFAVPATEGTPLNGYQYVVKTDKAEYVFDAMDKTLQVGNNKVKNVFLNLDKGEMKAKKVVDYSTTHFYVNGLELDSKAQTSNAVWCRLSVDGIEQTDFTLPLYKKTTFLCVSEENYNAGNWDEQVDWLSCSYWGANWQMTVTENTTGVSRTAYVKCIFPTDDPEFADYIFPEPKVQKVIQSAK